MNSVKTIIALSDLIDQFLLSGDFKYLYPDLNDISGTRRDQNGDLLVDFVKADQPEMLTIRISLSSK